MYCMYLYSLAARTFQLFYHFHPLLLPPSSFALPQINRNSGNPHRHGFRQTWTHAPQPTLLSWIVESLRKIKNSPQTSWFCQLTFPISAAFFSFPVEKKAFQGQNNFVLGRHSYCLTFFQSLQKQIFWMYFDTVQSLGDAAVSSVLRIVWAFSQTPGGFIRSNYCSGSVSY